MDERVSRMPLHTGLCQTLVKKTADFGSTLSATFISNCLVDLEKQRTMYRARLTQGVINTLFYAGHRDCIRDRRWASTPNPDPRTALYLYQSSKE